MDQNDGRAFPSAVRIVETDAVDGQENGRRTDAAPLLSAPMKGRELQNQQGRLRLDKGNGQIGHAAENTTCPGLFQQKDGTSNNGDRGNVEPKCSLRVLQ